MYAEIGWYNQKYGQSLLTEDTEGRSMKFLASSTVLHILFFASLWMVGDWMSEILPPAAIEISFLDTSATTAPEKTAPIVSQHSGETTATASKVVMKSVRLSNRSSRSVGGARKSNAAPVRSVPKTLDTSAFEKAIAAAPPKIKVLKMYDQDLDETFSSLRQEKNQKAVQMKKQLELSNEEDLLEQNTKAMAARQRLQQENADANARIQSLKSQHQSDVAAAKAAGEKADAAEDDRWAAEQAAEEARISALAAQMQNADQAAAETRASAAADRAAMERASQAEAQRARAASDQVARTGDGGASGKIRDVSELRAVPGNQRPHYDSIDRLQGRQGEVAFLAFVTKDGSVTQFKLLKSTGYRELDAKTFAAIRSWKFYPGQQGWVEIPFKWDLKGGAQEMPARLRTKVSSR